jgi:hypothetical protein
MSTAAVDQKVEALLHKFSKHHIHFLDCCVIPEREELQAGLILNFLSASQNEETRVEFQLT